MISYLQRDEEEQVQFEPFCYDEELMRMRLGKTFDRYLELMGPKLARKIWLRPV